MATIWASLNRPFFISQSSGSESCVFLYSQLALDLGKRTQQSNGIRVQYGYDAQGNRIRKRFSPDNGATWRYVYLLIALITSAVISRPSRP
ncbi:MAG: hypothetical protein EOO60_01825 [Hymenobacter sp.]|nr:MAG: hypothetical protein EOO60_01825 [Hymenobacter sp.]